MARVLRWSELHWFKEEKTDRQHPSGMNEGVSGLEGCREAETW